MKTWIIVGVIWFVIGVAAYLLILIFYPPTPLFNRKRREIVHYPNARVLPPFWNRLRLIWMFLVGLVTVPLVAPFLLLALVWHTILKPGNRSSE